ncbi:hypothetical protein ACLBV5_06960 [Brevundimonas sp. M1A4_2e]
MTAFDRTAARLIRTIRSRSNLRPMALFCFGAIVALLGTAFGMLNVASSALAALLIIAGVVLAAFAVAGILLRPAAANDN